MRVAIGSPEELRASLSQADFRVVAAVHAAIRRDPEAARQRGAVEALLHLASPGKGFPALQAMATLIEFEDEPVRQFFAQLLARGQGKALEAAAAYLLRHGVARPTLFPVLLGNESLGRVRTAARMLGPALPDDPEAVALRLALLDPASPLPQVPKELWLAELEGVLAREARAALRSQGREAFDWLLAERSWMDWLLLWGAQEWPLDCLEAIRSRFEDVGLRCLELAPALREPLAHELDRLASSPDRNVRLRAIRLGAWRALDQESDGELRAACLARWGREAPLEAVLACLEEDDWRVRAAASEELTRRGGEPVLEALRPLTRHAALPVRTAAVQILASLGQSEWLEEALLTP